MPRLTAQDQVEESICGLKHTCRFFWDGVITHIWRTKNSALLYVFLGNVLLGWQT